MNEEEEKKRQNLNKLSTLDYFLNVVPCQQIMNSELQTYNIFDTEFESLCHITFTDV